MQNTKCRQESQTCFRSSRPEVLCKKSILENFSKFKGKHMGWSLFFNKAEGSKHQARNLIEKQAPAQVFSREF